MILTCVELYRLSYTVYYYLVLVSFYIIIMIMVGLTLL